MKRYALIICGLLVGMVSSAQSPTLVKNINTNTADEFSSSFPGKGVVLNGYYYFPAVDYNGNELWKTDGTAAGTVLVKDIASIFDRQDANPVLLRVVGNDLFFFAQGQVNLYKLDGITGDLRNVLSTGNPTPHEAVVSGNFIFFTDSSWIGGTTNGWELSRFNILTGNYNTYDINPGPAGSYPHNLTVKGDSVFFAASNGSDGTELWMFDVINDYYFEVSDINPGADSSNPSDLVAYNDKLFFTADDDTSGNELWVSDGDASGTYRYADIDSGAGSSNPNHKTVFNDQLFYSASDGSNGTELWATDDFFSTTNIVADINVASSSSNPGKYGFHQAGSLLYFAADDGSSDNELWATDGTGMGTFQVADINPFGSSEPMDMYNLSDTLIFIADDGTFPPFQIWASDGTNTYELHAANAFADTPRISGIYNGRAYFGDNDGVIGKELWKTNGTPDSTVIVKDINLGGSLSSDPQWFEALNGFMYFGARTDNSYQFGLYRTDGSTPNTTLVFPGGGPNSFSVGYEHGRRMGSFLYFEGSTDTAGTELWKSDGTTAGTFQLKNINPGAGSGGPKLLTAAGATLYFVADDGTTGEELWKTDGTAAGTQLLKDVVPGTTSSGIRNMIAVNGNVFFVTDDNNSVEKLWYSNGTTAGTLMVLSVNAGPSTNNIDNLYVSGDTLYFRADDGISGLEPWISKGTVATTMLFKDVNPGPGPSYPEYFQRLGSYVYFGARSATDSPGKVWRTDGTSAGTAEFFNVNFPFFFTNIGGKLVFWTLPDTSHNGFHLWATNGTGAGTTEIESFYPGQMGYLILDEFPVYNGHWFLWLDDFISGQELWGTDGTAAGTIMYDIAPGPHSSYPRAARGVNPLIFSADDGSVNGREPWQLVVPPQAPLPISGLKFDARKEGPTALLEWSTYREENNLGFDVERSTDGRAFNALGFVPAKPNAVSGASYSFTDGQPFPGLNYYRLKQTDRDGRYEYSPVRQLDFSPSTTTRAYPNPTSDVLNVQTGYQFTNARINVRNMNGQLVRQQNTGGSNANGSIRIDVKNLAAGAYTAEILEGRTAVKLVFIKQ